MKKWLSVYPLSSGQLGILGVALYFLVYRFSVLNFLVVGFFLFFVGRKTGWQGLRKVLSFLVSLFLIFLCHRSYLWWQETHQPDQISQIQLIPDSIAINGDQLSFQGKEGGRTFQVFYRLKTEKEKQYFSQLSQIVRLKLKGELSLPDRKRNFNGFDYRDYLATKGIYRLLRIETIEAVVSVRSFSPLDWISSWRRKALVHIHQTFPDPMQHYMAGLLFGELDAGFEEMEDLYSRLGIIHLFALSGMQVGFFIALFRYPFLRLGMSRERVQQLQIPFSFFYAGLTGWSVSVVRSLVQKLLGNHEIRGLDNMALTLAICYLIHPTFLLGAGGILSFFYAFILTVLNFDSLSSFRKILTENLSISLAVLPFLIYYFYSFQPLSILLTFACSFLFDLLFLPLLSLLFALSPIVVLGQFNGLFRLLEKLLGLVGQYSGAGLVFGKPNLLLLLSLLIVLVFLHDYVQKKGIAFCFSLALLLLLFLVKHPLENEVTIVDVGQGDSIFLRDWKGKTILIDVGGRVEFEATEDWKRGTRDSNAERTLIPYLKSRGISQIDQLVLTHTDSDHIGDLEVVAKAMRIGEVLVSEGSLTDQGFVKRLRALKLSVRIIQAGDSLSIMGSRLHVLYPWEKGDGGNNDSVVLYGSLLDKQFLFTGDLEEGELELVKRYPNLPVDVLKAGHHGSKGSSYPEFLDHIKPTIGLFSAGDKNRYQHPHTETLVRFEERGIQTYQTKIDGAIRFVGWSSWKVETVR